ncbi:MAG: DUF2309 domain-containing protein, partial [Gammaproteobacteria bacterium]|nr:DUF2309 domain-containing protein [Gammaproteobacteria bacterium]
MSHAQYSCDTDSIKNALSDAIEHFEHLLPGQAPIKDFVHHNTLHGYQHLEFSEALAASKKLTGANGYLPLEQYRKFYSEGRINRQDLTHVIEASDALEAQKEIANLKGESLTQRDIYLTTLLHPLPQMTSCQLNWEIEDREALTKIQRDVERSARDKLLLNSDMREAGAVTDLWAAVLEVLGLQESRLHPESLTDLSPDEADSMISALYNEDERAHDQPLVHHLARKEALKLHDQLLDRVGKDLTLTGLLKRVTGKDLLEEIRPQIVRQVGSFLDHGLSAWHTSERSQGFYAAWRINAGQDLAWIFDDLHEWTDELEVLPDNPLDTIVIELRRLGLEEDRWVHYLEQIALEIPGWSGMFLWRHLNPDYRDAGVEAGELPVDMIDYLAVRLVLERLYAQRLCRKQWQIEASIDVLRWYFHRRRSEFLVRYTLFNGHLPEYLISRAQRLVEKAPFPHEKYHQWRLLGDMIWTWQQSTSVSERQHYTINKSGWQLFRMAQHLGLSGEQVRELNGDQLKEIFRLLKSFDEEAMGFIWLQAYEHNYRELFFNAVSQNHNRGHWSERSLEKARPQSQVVFCMDDREEGTRRHLEETNPQIETIGAAAHFNVPHLWKGVSDSGNTALTPVVTVPTHEVREQPVNGCEATQQHNSQRRILRSNLLNLITQQTRRSLVKGALIIAAATPITLTVLFGKLFAPLGFSRLQQRLNNMVDGEQPATYIHVTAEQAKSDMSFTDPQQGFTDVEQADRVEAFLKNIGVLNGHSKLFVIMGHGSMSQNNPHLAAYDCGACSGRHSGANARVLANFANRAEIRQMMKERGIDIPDDTHFIGGEHNTCDESITWYDADKIPESHRGDYQQLSADLDQATKLHAQERCRRFASAPVDPKLQPARDHIIGRSLDFSQARPELGHATNASAIIGRRSVSRGAFFDRRIFLISYDPTTDKDGSVLERLLLANGPVGAGISLEYYFSTV